MYLCMCLSISRSSCCLHSLPICDYLCVGNIKEVIQIALSMLVYSDKVSLQSILGISLTLASAQCYSYLQSLYKHKDFPQYYYWYVSM